MMEADQFEPELLAEKLKPLLQTGSASLDELEISRETLAELGFEVHPSRVTIPENLERLDESQISAALSERARGWITDLAALEVVGSTSTLLNDMATQQSVHGVVRLAELQLQGRGRRGRGWQSPYANNLAMSVGVHVPEMASELGGFSLSVGLAVADRLQMLGLGGVELKWPNDVLVHGRKIAGILIELHGGGAGTEIVIGVGINFHLPETVKLAIDQPVTDLHAAGQHFSRNLVAAGILSSLVDFVEGFASGGFEPMREAFNRQHHFHDRPATLLMGTDKVNGVVRGVGENGELLIELGGKIRSYNSGEVSLRPG